MTEYLLLLCMAYPEPSTKYGASVCMAGINEENEFRRIYPVPFDTFLKNNFHKKQWISYEVREKGDYRKESFKIRPETMQKYKKITDNELRLICKEKCSTIEELKARWGTDRTSLGIIKPDIIGISIKEKQINNKVISRNQQANLCGSRVPPIDLLKYDVQYKFTCSDNCNGHKCTCLDTEAGQLYRNIASNTDDSNEAIKKMEHALFSRLKNKDLYFLMGTHSFHPKSWMIISLLYPPKQDNRSLFDYMGTDNQVSVHHSPTRLS